MNKKLEEKLKSIRLREIDEAEKNSIWNAILFRRLHEEELVNKQVSYFSIFNWHIQKFVAVGALLMLFVIGGGVGVISASDKALPGSPLFSVDLAVENFQIKVAAPAAKDKLRLKFAEERVLEVKTISTAKSTTIKVASEDHESFNEINTIEFSKEENADVETALNSLTQLIEDTKDEGNAEIIGDAQKELLVLLGDDAGLTVKRVDGVISVDGDSKEKALEEVSGNVVETKEGESSEPSQEKIEDPTLEFESTIESNPSEVEANETVSVEDNAINTETTTPIPDTTTLSIVAEAEVFCGGDWHTESECKEYKEKGEGKEVNNGTKSGDGITPDGTVIPYTISNPLPNPNPSDPIVDAAHKKSCEDKGGLYDTVNKECSGIDGAMCLSIGGTWNECASACRNDPTAIFCTMQCIQICQFKAPTTPTIPELPVLPN